MKINCVGELMEYLKARLSSGDLSLNSEIYVYNSWQKIHEAPDFVITNDGDLDIFVTDYEE